VRTPHIVLRGIAVLVTLLASTTGIVGRIRLHGPALHGKRTMQPVQRRFASFVAIGALMLSALVGGAATASASSGAGGPRGPFGSANLCEQYVTNAGEYGVWDCEGVAGPYGGWYAITGTPSPWGPYLKVSYCASWVTSQGFNGIWDCEYVRGPYSGYYVFMR